MPATSPEAIRRKTEARIAKREAAKAAKALAVLENPPPVPIVDVTPVVVDVTPVVVDVTPVVVDVTPVVVDVTPVVVPMVPLTPVTDPFREWLATKQGRTLSTLRGANMQRLDAVYLDRVEAAFRAGYAAGVGDSI
jgi:hypothetical protein